MMKVMVPAPGERSRRAIKEILRDVVSARLALDLSTGQLAQALRSYRLLYDGNSNPQEAQSVQELVIRVRTDGTVRFEGLDRSYVPPVRNHKPSKTVKQPLKKIA